MSGELRIEHLKKRYGKVPALIDVNLTLHDGIYALLGPNGSGKSTFMNILSGILRPTEGKILWNGSEIASLGISYRSVVGYMPQSPAMYPGFRVKEFLYYLADIKEIDDCEKQINLLLDRVDLSDVTERRISALSGGMKQRLSLASALLGDPKILILDEPTAGLDPKQRVSVRNLISEIKEDKTIIWATHIVSDVESIADHIIFMKKGVASTEEKGSSDSLSLEERYLQIFGDGV